MIVPTIESLRAAAQAGITAVGPGRRTSRVYGAAANVGGVVIDVACDPEHGTFSWVVDGDSRDETWARRVLGQQG